MRIYEEMEPLPPAASEPNEMEWYPLTIKNQQQQQSIQDVTLKILQQGYIAKCLKDEPTNSSLKHQNWHVLPQQKSSSIDNSTSTTTHTDIVSVNQNCAGDPVISQAVSNEDKCLYCVKAYTREKRLRDRLRMAENFIHTMNRNLENDTVAISTIINKRTQLMTKLEETNLHLHREKHKCQTDLVNAETQLHDNKIKVKLLEVENEELKTLVDQLISSKVGSGKSNVAQQNSSKFIHLSSQPSTIQRDADSASDGVKNGMSNTNSLYTALRKEVDNKALSKSFSPKNEPIYEVDSDVSSNEPPQSASTPKKDLSSVITQDLKSIPPNLSSSHRVAANEGVKNYKPSLNTLYTAQRKQVEKIASDGASPEIGQVKQMEILWGIESEAVKHEVASRVNCKSSEPSTGTSTKKNAPKRDIIQTSQHVNEDSRVWDTSEQSALSADHRNQFLSLTPMSPQSLNGSQKDNFDQYLSESSVVSDIKFKDNEMNTFILSTKSLDAAYGKGQASTKYKIKDRSKSTIPTYNHYQDKISKIEQFRSVGAAPQRKLDNLSITGLSKTCADQDSHSQKRSSIESSSSKFPAHTTLTNHSAEGLQRSCADQDSHNQKRSSTKDSIFPTSSVQKQFAEYQGLEKYSTGSPRDSIYQNFQLQKRPSVPDSPLPSRPSVHTNFVEQGKEEECQSDECYILKLKDQTKSIRDELMNIQNLLSDLKE